MRTTRTLVIGAGQAGLALSRCLRDRGHDHLLVERGRIAERWYSERWDSLRLLTPNWMTRLPGHAYDGPDPDGFMTAAETAAFLAGYAASFGAPVLEQTAVVSVTRDDGGFHVLTTDGPIRADHVVVATGWCDVPAVPAAAGALDPSICQVVPRDYRNPDALPDGNVLVVGASATGVQLADELRRSGRQVTLAVGTHARVPRRYRGVDIFWWLDHIGAFDRTVDEVADVAAARTEGSLQLVGSDDLREVDLPTLHAAGVRLVGRVRGADGHRVRVTTDLPAVAAAADDRLRALLARIDEAIETNGLASEVLDPEPVVGLPALDVPDTLDLRAAGITTVVWATGHRRRYPWLHVSVLDERGEIRQRRGMTPVDGLYVLGQRFQHHRNSNFIDGVGRDAAFVAAHICAAGDRVAPAHDLLALPR